MVGQEENSAALNGLSDNPNVCSYQHLVEARHCSHQVDSDSDLDDLVQSQEGLDDLAVLGRIHQVETEVESLEEILVEGKAVPGAGSEEGHLAG